jgi:hypothetical protein
MVPMQLAFLFDFIFLFAQILFATNRFTLISQELYLFNFVNDFENSQKLVLKLPNPIEYYLFFS